MKKRTVTSIALALASAIAMLRRARPRNVARISNHYDGNRFFNPAATPHGFAAVLKWVATRKPSAWAEWYDIEIAPPPSRRVNGDQLKVTVVNHATVLLQFDGINVLADPIWSERCSPVSFAGPKRHHDPGIRFEDLPDIDVVIISHNHYDHLDLPTLRRVEKRFHPLFVCGAGNGLLLRRAGMTRVKEVDWWDEVSLPNGVVLTAVPAQHFSSRGLHDRDATLWLGYVLSGSAGSAYFAGDTGFGPHIDEIARRFDDLRVALLPIGAFLPRWFMNPVHMAPEDAVNAHLALSPAISIPIHHGTFALGDDGPREAMDLLKELVAGMKIEDEFVFPRFGAAVEVPTCLRPAVVGARED